MSHPTQKLLQVTGRVVILFACGSANLFNAPAQTVQNRTSVLVLKDPTPREPDLEKVLNPPKPEPPKSAVNVGAYNQKRYELIRQASAHIESLAAVLQRSITEHRDGASRKPEIQVADAIEMLSGNIYGALATRPDLLKSEQAQAGSSSPVPEPPLQDQAAELAALSTKLKQAVAKSDPNALPVGVLLTSANVRRLAHDMKGRMEQPAP